MRIENWHSKEIFKAIEEQAYDNANAVMDQVVEGAKLACPPPGKTNIFRPPGWASADVSFTPSTGDKKGKLVAFHTDKRWTGREPGDLKNTIRRVNKNDDASASIRVYAGNFKIYWAFMVERGTSSTGWGGPAAAQPFLRPTFHKIKTDITKKIANGGVL
ncbi:MAG: hypothetical protein WCX48_11120 [Bacteroidales bacterium]